MLALLLAASLSCPRMLEVDPKEWKEALLKAAPGSKEQGQLLEQLGFRPGPVHTFVERVSFLDARGDQLSKVFELKTRETSSEAPEEPAPVIERTVKPVGRRFPRELLVTEEVSCPEGNPGGSCTPDRRRAVHALSGGKYVAR